MCINLTEISQETFNNDSFADLQLLQKHFSEILQNLEGLMFSWVIEVDNSKMIVRIKEEDINPHEFKETDNLVHNNYVHDNYVHDNYVHDNYESYDNEAPETNEVAMHFEELKVYPDPFEEVEEPVVDLDLVKIKFPTNRTRKMVKMSKYRAYKLTSEIRNVIGEERSITQVVKKIKEKYLKKKSRTYSWLVRIFSLLYVEYRNENKGLTLQMICDNLDIHFQIVKKLNDGRKQNVIDHVIDNIACMIQANIIEEPVDTNDRPQIFKISPTILHDCLTENVHTQKIANRIVSVINHNLYLGILNEVDEVADFISNCGGYLDMDFLYAWNEEFSDATLTQQVVAAILLQTKDDPQQIVNYENIKAFMQDCFYDEPGFVSADYALDARVSTTLLCLISIGIVDAIDESRYQFSCQFDMLEDVLMSMTCSEIFDLYPPPQAFQQYNTELCSPTQLQIPMMLSSDKIVLAMYLMDPFQMGSAYVTIYKFMEERFPFVHDTPGMFPVIIPIIRRAALSKKVMIYDTNAKKAKLSQGMFENLDRLIKVKGALNFIDLLQREINNDSDDQKKSEFIKNKEAPVRKRKLKVKPEKRHEQKVKSEEIQSHQVLTHGSNLFINPSSKEEFAPYIPHYTSF